MTTTAPLVSVIVPVRNERLCIETFLSSVLSQECIPDMEVIVADGVSDDGTSAILRQMSLANSRIRVIENPQRIVSTGLNAALRVARGAIVVRMDSHTEYAPDYVRRCVEVLEQTGADNVGGPWVARGASLTSRAIAAAFQSPFAVGGARSHNLEHEGQVDSVYLGCWRKTAFERFGYFDEELVRNQDDEHNLRIVRGGGRIWQSPKIKSWYQPRSSLKALFNQYMQYGYWKVRVIQKHKLPASWRHLVPVAFLLALAGLGLIAISGFLASAVSSAFSTVGYFAFTSLLVLVAAYLVAVFGASLLTAARTDWLLLPLLPAVFGCYHFGYGYGFLHGIWGFVIRRRQPGESFVKLTRQGVKRDESSS